MKIAGEKWHSAIQLRRSRRQFNGEPLHKEVLRQLLDFAEELNSSVNGFRAIIVTENPEKAFKGFIGAYGQVKNAPAYVAFIGEMSEANVQENCGFYGECFILEATALGLATCWIGGFFNQEVVQGQINLKAGEKVLAISPLGYVAKDYNLEEKLMSGLVGSRKRKSLATLCKGLAEAKWPAWVRPSLEAARLAPSAVNRQPWRFEISENSIIVSVDSSNFALGISKRLDCGIAMLHLQVGALRADVQGSWEYLNSPEVARFLF